MKLAILFCSSRLTWRSASCFDCLKEEPQRYTACRKIKKVTLLIAVSLGLLLWGGYAIYPKISL